MKHVNPLETRIGELLRFAFMTCVSADGTNFVKVEFPTLELAQEFHDILVKLAVIERDKNGA